MSIRMSKTGRQHTVADEAQTDADIDAFPDGESVDSPYAEGSTIGAYNILDVWVYIDAVDAYNDDQLVRVSAYYQPTADDIEGGLLYARYGGRDDFLTHTNKGYHVNRIEESASDIRGYDSATIADMVREWLGSLADNGVGVPDE